ncbi:hypothetical protein QTP88_005910 [Uroleucon formosanum]
MSETILKLPKDKSISEELKKMLVEWCYNDIKWMTKGKVPSKSSYNKTGGGEQPDDEHLLKIQNSILNLIDSTVIHGHEEIRLLGPHTSLSGAQYSCYPEIK